MIPTRTVTGWRMCTDYRKLNKAARKDHFPLPFIDQMLERLACHSYFSYLDGYSGFLRIPIHPSDQDKTTFTCPYGTFAYRRLPFGLCNAPGTFRRCVISIFNRFDWENHGGLHGWFHWLCSCLSLWVKCLLINRLNQTFCLQDSKQLLPPPYKLAYECMLETRIWALNSSFPRLILLTWLPCLLQLMPRL